MNLKVALEELFRLQIKTKNIRIEAISDKNTHDYLIETTAYTDYRSTEIKDYTIQICTDNLFK